MSTKHIIELLARYEKGECTDAEKQLIDQWFEEHGATELRFDHMDADQQKHWVDALFADITQVNQENQRAESKVIRLWPRIAVAAAAVAVIVSSIYFYSRQGSIKTTQQTAVVNDIAPGKNGATITLANGKVIQLSDAKSGVVVGKDLKYNDGIAVQGDESQLKSGEVTQLTASTARGQTYQFTLPDGTKVWLNADSKISFPSQFSGKERKILLSGEGYFEVFKDREHPFIVETEKQEIKVLGTHFNVNSYNDEPETKTSLLEGSVKINDATVLKPGEQAITNTSNKTKIAEADVNSTIAWKNGKFIFEDEDIESIMRKLSRWYNVEVIYQGDFSNKTFDGSISRSDNISKILEKITFTQAVHFKIEGRRIYIMP